MPPNHGREGFRMSTSRQLLEESTQTEESGAITSTFSDQDAAGTQIDFSADETEGVIERLSRLFSLVRT